MHQHRDTEPTAPDTASASRRFATISPLLRLHPSA